MLAFMSPTVTPLPFHTPDILAMPPMSVAILPSAPLERSQNSSSAPPASASSPSKRPKLSLNTAGVQVVPSVIGKGYTSLRLDTLSATSPTSRNTFKNTYSPQSTQPFDSSRLTLSPQSFSGSDSDDQAPSYQADDSDYSDPAGSSASSYSTASASTTDSYAEQAPYYLPTNTRSILSNGPIPRMRYRKTAKKMFPPRKTVSFRTPLTEEVQTCQSAWTDVDLEVVSSPLTTSPPQSTRVESPRVPARGAAAEQSDSETTSITSRTKISIDMSNNEESTLCPATPVAGKRKRDRQWVWTLGPDADREPDVDAVPSESLASHC